MCFAFMKDIDQEELLGTRFCRGIFASDALGRCVSPQVSVQVDGSSLEGLN